MNLTDRPIYRNMLLCVSGHDIPFRPRDFLHGCACCLPCFRIADAPNREITFTPKAKRGEIAGCVWRQKLIRWIRGDYTSIFSFEVLQICNFRNKECLLSNVTDYIIQTLKMSKHLFDWKRLIDWLSDWVSERVTDEETVFYIHL